MIFMKYSLRLFTLTILIIYALSSQAQEGNELTPEGAHFIKENKEKRSAYFNSKSIYRGWRYAPVQLWIHRQSDGSGGINDQQALDALDELNANFAAAKMKFVPCEGNGISYIENTNLYDISVPSFWYDNVIEQFYQKDDVINIYFAHEVSNTCGKGSFPWETEYTGVFMNTSSSTCMPIGTNLTHEMGHYFGLLHTHEAFYGLERADGSNCLTAGDRICDTPADPGLHLGNWSNYDTDNCVYTGSLTDAVGDAYAPDEKNFMSYATYNCTSEFTSEQINLMHYYFDNDRSNLNCSPTCNQTIDVYPYQQRFTSFSLCSTANGANCTLPASSGWYNVDEDDLDWITDRFGTPSNNTGPSSFSKYLYVEASGNGVGYPRKLAYVYTPCFDLPFNIFKTATLKFKYHKKGFGQLFSSLSVDINAGDGWDRIFTKTGSTGSSWQNVSVPISIFEGKTAKFRFVAKTGNFYTSDIAIDNVSIEYEQLPFGFLKQSEENGEEQIISEALDIKIYPNPGNGQMTLLLNQPSETKWEIEVIDLQGRIMHRKEWLPIENPALILDLQSLSRGSYILRVLGNETVLVKQVILE